jgi:hypothetical protein
MIAIGNFQAREPEVWRVQLDRFVVAHQLELAALAWGLSLEGAFEQEGQDILGIDLKPLPHFVYCSKVALEDLNKTVGHQIQEILGLVENHKRDQEVLILAIGDGQVKLINYQSDPSPPACFEKVGEGVMDLLDRLEQALFKYMGE